MIGRDGANGEPGLRGELFCKRSGSCLQMQPLQPELGSGQLGLQEFAERVNTGLSAVLFDLYQTVR